MAIGRDHVVTMMSGLAKFFLGVVLAIAVMIGGGAALALYFMHRVTTAPPRPVFANDTTVKGQSSPAPTLAAPPTKAAEQSTTTTTSGQSPSPKPLEPGAYQAKVTWSDGLSLRTEPNFAAERIGGVGYNQQIVVLSESPDKKWQKIRLEDSEQEGWIKAGNIERVQE